MTAVDRLLIKYPSTKISNEEYDLDDANFNKQRQKLTLTKSIGGSYWFYLE